MRYLSHKLTLAQIMHVGGHKMQKTFMDYNKHSSEEIADELMSSTPKKQHKCHFFGVGYGYDFRYTDGVSPGRGYILFFIVLRLVRLSVVQIRI